ncbi:MAG: beta strand repeat-containing protein [Microbacteriaceae bacterium]
MPISIKQLNLPAGTTTTAVTDGQTLTGSEAAELIAGKDGAGKAQFVATETSGAVQVSDAGGSLTVDSLQLPAALDGSGNLKVAVQGTPAVTVTGVATAANQATEISSLASLDSKTPTVGQKTSANSSPVVLSSDQSAIPVSISSPALADSTVTGSITASGQSVTTGDLSGQGTGTFTISGTFTATLVFEATADGTNWFGVYARVPSALTVASITTIASGGTWRFACGGYQFFRIRASAYTSGTITVTIRTSPSTTAVAVESLPPGTNTIGYVAQTGTWTVAQGTPTATPANRWPVQLSDGTTLSKVVAASTAAAATDPALVVAVSPNNTVAVSAASLPLAPGAATSAKQPALGTAGTPSADVLTVQGAASMTALKVDGSAVTQPVLGVDATVTGNLTTAGDTVVTGDLSGQGTGVAACLGTFSSANIAFEGTVDGTFWQALYVKATNSASPTTASTFSSGTLYRFPCGGLKLFRVRLTSITSGTVNVTLRTSPSTSAISLVEPLPVGTNTIGVVNQGSASSTANAWPLKVTDGTSIAAVKAATTPVTTSDPALVVALSNLPVSSSGTISSSGSTTSLALSGRTAVSVVLSSSAFVSGVLPQASIDGGTNWVVCYWCDLNPFNATYGVPVYNETFNTVVSSTFTRAVLLPPGATNVRLTSAGVFTSGSATYTISAGVSPLFDTSFVGGASKATLRAGAKGSTSAADATSTASGANHQALDVALYDALGNQLGTASNPLRVDTTNNTAQAVTGTVTATATQGTAAALTGAWPTKLTDGTNTMPTADSFSRPLFARLTDGSSSSVIKASGQVAQSTDAALVVALSPNMRGATPSTAITAAVTTTSSTALAASSRIGACVTNVGATTVYIYFDSVAAVAGTKFTVALAPGAYYELPQHDKIGVYKGGVQAITASGSSTLVIQEFI